MRLSDWTRLLLCLLPLSVSFTLSFAVPLCLSLPHFCTRCIRFRSLSSRYRLGSGFLDLILSVFLAQHAFAVIAVADVRPPHPVRARLDDDERKACELG